MDEKDQQIRDLLDSKAKAKKEAQIKRTLDSLDGVCQLFRKPCFLTVTRQEELLGIQHSQDDGSTVCVQGTCHADRAPIRGQKDAISYSGVNATVYGRLQMLHEDGYIQLYSPGSSEKGKFYITDKTALLTQEKLEEVRAKADESVLACLVRNITRTPLHISHYDDAPKSAPNTPVVDNTESTKGK